MAGLALMNHKSQKLYTMKKLFVAMFAALCVLSACKKDEDIVDDGSINSLFSVSPTKQVKFSKGNLQYQAVTGTWRFAENQYDYKGEANSSISDVFSGWIDLFGWATSGWDCGNVYYMPYDKDFVDNDEIGLGYGPKPVPDKDLTGEFAKCDWGVNCAISNGGNKAGMWRTLSAEEWNYLANDRTNAKSLYGAACIEGTNGLVLLPDDWTKPEGCTFTPGMGEHDDMSYYARKNSMTIDQWRVMEKNGAVFLPACGTRVEYAQMTFVNDIGGYWSTTSFKDNSYFKECAYVFYFQSDMVMGKKYDSLRSYGRAVRLVRDAK